ncbi:uncharacterized protein TNIN_196711 [Trichonephila inaurata madagascariensis]|uniref:Uncharacterized protein n=1 Tax=Trichonephila inaurata madagascariensis TaxID=2747483 RepID=A0A8X6WZR3_9ARAC|nr:uncharacterized protein TNIN_196711 [Trichonephila inaurata madagascariensis]
MGDADSEAIVQIPVQEIEAWMDEAEEVVDEGLENLLAFMTNLNGCMRSITMELKSLQTFQNIVNALSFFIVPIAIAVLVCYGTRETFEISGKGLETGFQAIVMLLMFLSTSVGIPYYVFTVWESYKISNNLSEIRRSIRNATQDEEQEVSLSQLYDRQLIHITNDLSLDRFIEFSRMLNSRMPNSIREVIERSRETENDLFRLRAFSLERESSETEINGDQEIDDTSPTEPTDEELNNLSLEKEENETPVLYQFQVIVPKENLIYLMKISPAKNEENG